MSGVATLAAHGASVNATEVEVPYLYDDGTTVQEATLCGTVHALGDWEVVDMRIVLRDGDEVDVPRNLRMQAGDDLRCAADDMWRKR